MTPKIERADAFQAFAHGSISQRRRYTRVPYSEHPRAVARLVGMAGLGDDAIEVALLHDVVEDTPFGLSIIRQAFGDKTAVRVDALTSPDALSGLSRATRKAIALRKIAGGDFVVQSVKLADVIDNVSTIVSHDSRFARAYLGEKVALLDVIGRASPVLLDQARDALSDALRALQTRMAEQNRFAGVDRVSKDGSEIVFGPM